MKKSWFLAPFRHAFGIIVHHFSASFLIRFGMPLFCTLVDFFKIKTSETSLSCCWAYLFASKITSSTKLDFGRHWGVPSLVFVSFWSPFWSLCTFRNCFLVRCFQNKISLHYGFADRPWVRRWWRPAHTMDDSLVTCWPPKLQKWNRTQNEPKWLPKSITK